MNIKRETPIYKFPSDKIESYKKETDYNSKEFLDRVGTWGSYYRLFPFVFVKDYLNITLKPFQAYLLYEMNHSDEVAYIATRGQGKTFLTAILAVVRCILYPGTKVVATAPIKKQASLIYKKIEDIMQDSPNLRREISSMTKAGDSPIIRFYNGSTIEISASNENARGLRSNFLILDEREKMNEEIIDSVLKKFNAIRRQPPFRNRKEYANYPTEPNKIITLSSAGMKKKPLYRVFLDHLYGMVRGRRMFACGLPYQISIKYGLLEKEDIVKEMEKIDYNEIIFSMEMMALFYGTSSSGFFELNDFEKTQIEEYPLYPKWSYKLLNNKDFKYPEKEEGELRVLGVDVALSSNKQSDDAIISATRLIPNGKRYVRKPSFMLSYNGMHTKDLVLAIKRAFYDLDCDYAILDYRNMGISIYDLLSEQTLDKERNTVYPPWKSFNSIEHAERAKDKSAQPLLYTMIATAQLNTQMAFKFKSDLENGYVILPVDQYTGREKLSNIKGFSNLSPTNQAMFEAQYAQFDSMIAQTVNMTHTVNASGTLTFHSGDDGKKDRYTSVTYANYLADVLESDLTEPDASSWGDYIIW